MKGFNCIGLIIVGIIMIPNIIYAIKHKEDFDNSYNNKIVLVLEQIGRYGSIAFMMFNIPWLSKGFWFDKSLFIYLMVNGALLLFYGIVWVVFWNKNSKFKVLALSIVPSLIFLFCGIILLNIPLLVAAILFSIGHVTVSVKNYT